MKLRNKITLIAAVIMLIAIALLYVDANNPLSVIPYGSFDDCDATSNLYGNWGSVGGTVTVNTQSPRQGSGNIRLSAGDEWHTWLFKDTSGDLWDFSQNPLASFYLRASKVMYMEFGIVTITGATQWESSGTVITINQIDTWQRFDINLQQLVNYENGGSPDLTQVYRIYIYVLNEYNDVTIDIDDISMTNGQAPPTSQPTISPSAEPTDEPEPKPKLTIQIVSGSGSYSPSDASKEYPSPSTVTLVFTPSTGYSFDRTELFDANGNFVASSTSTTQILNVDRPYVLKVYFKESSPPVDIPGVGVVDQTTLGLSIIFAFTLGSAIIALAYRKGGKSGGY